MMNHGAHGRCFQPESQAIDACAKARNLAKAEELFNEMQDGQMEG